MLICSKCKTRMVSLPMPASMDEPDVCVRMRKCRTCGFKAWTEERFMVKYKSVSLKQQAKDDPEFQDILRRCELAISYFYSSYGRHKPKPPTYEDWLNPENRAGMQKWLTEHEADMQQKKKLLDDPNYLAMKRQIDPDWSPDG